MIQKTVVISAKDLGTILIGILILACGGRPKGSAEKMAWMTLYLRIMRETAEQLPEGVQQ